MSVLTSPTLPHPGSCGSAGLSAENAAALRAILGAEVPASLLEIAVTHPSATGKGSARTLLSNQRLEFLGDALVGGIVAARLYALHPDQPEGALTARKIACVRREALAAACGRLGLARFMVLGPGAALEGGRDLPSNQSDLFEALVGALYEAAGWDSARAFVERALAPELARPALTLAPAKNRLQELTQSLGLGTPSYRTVAANGDTGPFESEALLGGEIAGRGSGASKKAAEESAAEAALLKFAVDS